MTVTATNRKDSFTTNGVTVDFPFTFSVNDVSQVKAITIDTDGVETPYLNFSVVLNESIEGGVLTTNDTLNNVDLLVYRMTSITQQVDYINGGRFPANSHEEALDLLTQQNQEQQEELDRTLKAQISLQNPPELGELEEGKLLTVTGNVIVAASVTEQDLVDAADNANTAAAAANQAVIDVYGTDIGNYEDDVTFTSYDQYAVYQRGTTPTFWKPKAITPLPYQVNSGVTPDTDTNIESFIQYSPASLQTQIDQNASDISQNESDIATNAAEIAKKTSYVENRFKGNQIPVVAGTTGNPLVSATPEDYAIGEEPAFGYEMVIATTNLIYDSGIFSTVDNVGVIRRRYTKDSAGFITKNSQYGGVQLPDGTQLQAVVDDIITTGVRITEDSGDVCVDVDLSHANIIASGGFKFHGLSSEPGVWSDINDIDSYNYLFKELRIGVGQEWQAAELTDTGATFPDGTLSYRTNGVTYTNTTGRPIKLNIQVFTFTGNFAVNGLNLAVAAGTDDDILIEVIIPDGATYSLGAGNIRLWREMREV